MGSAAHQPGTRCSSLSRAFFIASSARLRSVISRCIRSVAPENTTKFTANCRDASYLLVDISLAVDIRTRIRWLKTSKRSEWTEVFGSERLTGALLDRLTHHVHILEMSGESFRLKQSRSGQKTKTR